jgi:phenylacetate-coenzyme A ligase PaaK-like adenylate-forming protein
MKRLVLEIEQSNDEFQVQIYHDDELNQFEFEILTEEEHLSLQVEEKVADDIAAALKIFLESR